MSWGEPGSGAGVAEWLAQGLFDRRVIQLSGVLDERVAGEVVAQLMTLDALGTIPWNSGSPARGAPWARRSP